MNKFYISFDTDWVPDEVLDYTLSILDEFGINATFFCTNKTECDLKNHLDAFQDYL
jgi:peptidoglycan/xylan/chitin deacetylase (PgdA/CDA1 family)